MKTIPLLDGECVPVLGQGTWRMGENTRAHKDEVAALRLADAIEDQRARVLVVTKVYPHNASRTELPKACERSLKRLRIDAIDLYLLHWRETNTRLEETVEAFEKLRGAGKIKRWGVSNFDVEDMEDLWSIENGTNCAANQVLYNLENREIESGLLQWNRNNKIPIMAYSPVGHGRGLLENATLRKIAKRHDGTTSQIALAWVLRQPGVIAIPKATNEKHVRDNARSIDIKLTKENLADLDREFPAPKSKKPLPML